MKKKQTMSEFEVKTAISSTRDPGSDQGEESTGIYTYINSKVLGKLVKQIQQILAAI